ncbi:MAG: hypothetical protein FVQ79_04360 [Planctomycetes bacterium]|nr:hypothetical protein [Planctomycetota bacterium]
MSFKTNKWEHFRYKCQERWEGFKQGFVERFSRKDSGVYRGYKHSRMSAFRDWVNKYHHLPMILCGVSMFILLFVAAMQMVPEKTQPSMRKDSKQWYYDLNTGELFVGKKGLIPPVESPSGALADGTDAGVLAHVRTYADDPKASDLVVVYLETLSVEAKLEMEECVALGKSSDKPWYYGRSVKRPGDSEWYPVNSAEARTIIQSVSEKNSAGQSPRSF